MNLYLDSQSRLMIGDPSNNLPSCKQLQTDYKQINDLHEAPTEYKKRVSEEKLFPMNLVGGKTITIAIHCTIF